jgi:transposase InsO family protein
MCREVIERGRSVIAVAKEYGYARKTVYKWLALWLAGGRCQDAVADRSRAPHHSPRRMSDALVAAIAALALRHRECGLVRLHRMAVNAGATISVHGVYIALVRAGVYQPRKRRQGRRRYQKVVHSVPGEHVQVDLMELPHRRYQLTLIDSATRYAAVAALPAKDVATVKKALIRMISSLPFPVQTLQTDHGTEFTYAFMPHVTKQHPLDEWCEQHGISHRLIPIAYPPANGKVERLHRIFRDEFYRNVRLRPGQTWAALLPRYVNYYNTRREHGSLQWRTPQQQLQLLQRDTRDTPTVTHV